MGSEDYDIRIFQGEEVYAMPSSTQPLLPSLSPWTLPTRLPAAPQFVIETTETDQIVALAPLADRKYAYALANGTVGVYERATRVCPWQAAFSPSGPPLLDCAPCVLTTFCMSSARCGGSSNQSWVSHA